MFDQFKRKKKATAGEWIANEFRAAKAEMENSVLDEMFFAIPLAKIWTSFLDDFEDPSRFTKLPRYHQMNYFRTSLAQLEHEIANAEPDTALPYRIFTFYLAFLINNNTELANEAAHFMDQYARKGWELAFANRDHPVGSTKRSPS